MANHDTHTVDPGRIRLSGFIRHHRSRIMADWERSVRQLPYAQGLSQPRLFDHLPDLLDRVANVVDSVHTGANRTLEEVPEVHALERLDSGFDLDEVAEEYALLRSCILQLYIEHVEAAGAACVAMAMREVVNFNRTFDEAVSAAVSRYSRARERTLVALDRISEAALGTEDLGTFLPRLLRVMLETTEAVDSVILFLREGDLLRVHASVGLEDVSLVGLTRKVGEGFSGQIAAEQRPLALRSAATDPRVGTEAIRASGTRALYGVPLLHGGEVIGVAHMGSRTAYEFSNEDKLLFRAMVSRATGLIVQAQLAARERAAREDAEAHKQLLRLVLDQSGDAIIMVDERGVVRLFNAEAERQHGMGMKAVPPEQWADAYGLLTLDGRPMPVEAAFLYRALQGETVPDARWKVLRPDGTVRTFCGTASPVRRPDGALVGAVLTARDETERLQHEREQAEAFSLLDALLTTATVGIAILDQDLRYVRINEPLAAINGLPVEAHIGRTVSEVLPRRAPMIESLLRRVLETGEAIQGVEFSFVPAHDPGTLHHFIRDYFPVRARDGRVLGLAGVFMDITERKQQEERLRQTAEFRERFLGIVSHDLRNPLNAILLSANALLRSEGIPPSHTRMVRRIATSGERMVRMIQELLDFTRGRLGGGIPIQPRTVNLRHLCRHLLEELEISNPGRELRLEGEGHFLGTWDPDRLTQLLGNLGKNALDYSPPGTSVDFRLHDEGDTVRVEVHNDGAPIPEERLAHIFEPFRRATEEELHAASGLGLGLFIVQQITQAHGGSVEVRSSRDEGTTFTVRLPRVPPSQACPAGP